MNADRLPTEWSWKTWPYCLAVVAVTAGVWWLCCRFPITWIATGIGEANRPFLDLYALLAGCDAEKLGLNPLLPNPLDPYNRPFGFSDWWFELGRLGLGRKDTLWLGTLLLAVTLLGAVAFVRPANQRESFLLGSLLISPAMLMAVNRCNQDLVVFLLVSLGLVCFRSEGRPARTLGVILFAAAAVLKYFPLVTLVLLLDFRSRRELIGGFITYAVVLLLAWPGLAPALQLASQHAPSPQWLYAFGVPVLWRDLGWDGWTGWLTTAVLLAVWASWEAWKRVRLAPARQLDKERTAERDFICGAAMIVGVFFLGVSYVYKLVFALWLLPWLCRQNDGDVVESRWRRAIGCLLLAVAWLEGTMAVLLNLIVAPWSQSVAVSLLKGTLIIAQLLTWALVACLLRFLLIYIGRCGKAQLLNG